MPRARITFADIAAAVEVPAGTRLIEVSEQAGAGIVYGCREGECCTCLTEIVAGYDNLAPRHHRLACQAQVLKGEIVVRQG